MEVQSLLREIAYKSCTIEINDEHMDLVLEGINISSPDGETLLIGGNNTLSMDWDEVKITKVEEEQDTVYSIKVPGRQVYIRVPRI